MISAEERAEIRRLHFAEHWKVGTIATALGLHPDTVRRAIDGERPRAICVRASVLDPFTDFIRQTLEQHPRLRSTRLFEMLHERGYQGSVVQLRRHVGKVRPPSRVEAFFRLRTYPGEVAQVDWAHFGTLQVGRAERALSCFVLVLSWSRALYAEFFLNQTLESFLAGHVRAFSDLGGVAREIWYDNLKSVVLERAGDAVRFHPRILDLAGHYHFAPKPCAPARGNEKGRVERAIQYLRHSFFAARSFTTLADLNAQLRRWRDEIAHARRLPDEPELSVQEALVRERARLLPLPEAPFPTDLVRPVASDKTPYVRFDRNVYSIPPDRVGKTLTLVAGDQEVRLFDGTERVACHRRSYSSHERVEDPAHLAALARDKRRAHEMGARDRLRAEVPAVDALLAALAARGEPMAAHAARLRSLLDRYGAREMDLAVREAVERGTPSAPSVAHVLERRRRERREKPPLDVVLPDDPRVRDLRLTPHRLEDYDELTGPDEPDPHDAP